MWKFLAYRALQRSRFLLPLLAIAFIACPIPLDLDESIPSNEQDPTQMEGLSIYGEQTIACSTSSTCENSTEIGALDIPVLHSTIISECADHLWNGDNAEGITHSECDDNCLLRNTPLNDETGCWQSFCRAELSRCVAFKYIELAEAISETTITGTPRDPVFYYMNNTLSFFFGNSHSYLNAHSYRIPPLSPESKTLAYLIALDSMNFWAEQSDYVLQAQGTCLNYLKTYDVSNDQDSRGMLTAGFGEAVVKYGEVTKKLVENQLNVAVSKLSSTPDFSKAQNDLWVGGFNSHFGALKVLLNRNMQIDYFSSPEPEPPLHGCPVALSARAGKHTLKLLRKAGLESTFDKNTDTREVIAAVAQSTGFCAPSDCLGQVDDFLYTHKVSESDFSLARQYLRDEDTAFRRIRTAGDDKMYGMHAPRFQNPPSYYTKWTYNSTSGTTEQPSPQYSKSGAAQAMDYMREVAAMTIITQEGLLSHDQLKLLAQAAGAAETFVGKTRVTTEFITSNFRVIVYGLSTEEQAQVVLLDDESAYRCAVEGTIDGAPCSLSFVEDHALAEVFRKFHRYDPSKSGHPLESRLMFDIDKNSLRIGGSYFLVRLSRLGFSELLAVIRPDDATAHIMPVLQGGKFNDLVKKAVQKDCKVCGLPELPCADVAYSRDFVPALENELISDGNDMYESSWKFYLERAKLSASRADQLGQDLIQAGLTLDQTSEQARGQVEGECGGVLDLDLFDVIDGEGVCTNINIECDIITEMISKNPSLANCLPEEWGGTQTRIENSTLGVDRLCSFVNIETGNTCECDGDEWCQVEGFKCPVVVAEDFEDCASIFNINDIEKYKVLKLFNPLGVFDTPYAEVGTSDTGDFGPCTTTPDDWLEDFNQASDFATREQLVSDNAFFNTTKMKKLLSRIDFNELYLLWHYEFRFDGNLIWSTYIDDDTKCPNDPPWESSNQVICVNSPTNNPLGYAYDSGAALDEKYDWLELEIESGSFGRNRQDWGRNVLKTLFAMGLVAGQISGATIAQEMIGAKDSPCSPTPVTNTHGPLTPDFIWPYLDTYHQFPEDTVSTKEVYCLNSAFSPGYEFEEFEFNELIDMGPGAAFCYNEMYDWHSTYNCPGGPGFRQNLRYLYRTNMSLFLTPEEGTDGWLQFYNSLPAFIAGSEYSVTESTFTFEGAGKGFVTVNHDTIAHELHLTRHGDLRRLNWPFAETEVTLTRQDFIDGMKLACHLRENGATIAEDNLEQGLEMPVFDMPGSGNVERDIQAIRDYVVGLHRRMLRAFSSAVLPQLPEAFKDGYVTGDMTNLYENYKGNNLNAMIEIAQGLDSLASAAKGLDMAFFKIVQTLDTMVLEQRVTDEETTINDLERSRSIASNLANAMSSIASALSSTAQLGDGTNFNKVSHGLSALASMVSAACHFAIMDIDLDINTHRANVIGLGGDIKYRTSLIALADHYQALWTAASQIEQGYLALQGGINKLDSVQSNAAGFLAKYLIMDSDPAGRAMHTNTVTRRIYNTLKYRYDKAKIAAKNDAFLAKRAIEFRIGRNLSEFEEPLGSVESPSEWSDDICKMQGFDYRQLRNADPEDPLYTELAESQHYGEWFIGDYVQKLDDFIVAYVNKHPFTDEDDIAVLSLKNDIMKARSTCELPSPNRLIYSSQIGHHVTSVDDTCMGSSCSDGIFSESGWKVGGCLPGQTITMEACELGATSYCSITDDCVRADFSTARIGDSRQQIGANFILDSNMEDSGVSSWTATNASLLKIGPPYPAASRTLQVSRLSASGAAYAAQSHTGPLGSDGQLRLIGWAKGDGTSAPQVSIGTATMWTGNSSVVWQKFSVPVSHLASNGTEIRLEVTDGSVGNSVEFENVGLHPVIDGPAFVGNPPVAQGIFRFTTGRTTTASNTGYIFQRLENLEPGYYVLSWTDKHPEDNPGLPVEYKVSVYDVIDATETAWPYSARLNNVEYRHSVAVEKYDWNDLEIRFLPSSTDSTIGDVHILKVQLERIGDWDLLIGTAPVATAYVENKSTPTISSNDCEDTTGVAMRGNFRRGRICVNRSNHICLSQDRGSEYEQWYREYPIIISLEMLERQGYLASGSIALGNFNYRQGKMALNVVGTNVIDCEHSPTPSTCYSNAFLQYSIRHDGVVFVKNYNNELVEFKMPAAKIEHAKALAAEVVVTNPMSSNTSQLLSDYWKSGLQGRPFQGQYLLRIWETPGLSWQNVEDIQILYRYRYWTPME